MNSAQAESAQYPEGFDSDLCVGKVQHFDKDGMNRVEDQVDWLNAMGINTGAFTIPGQAVKLSHSVPSYGWPDVFRMHAEGYTCDIAPETFESFEPKIFIDLNSVPV